MASDCWEECQRFPFVAFEEYCESHLRLHHSVLPNHFCLANTMLCLKIRKIVKIGSWQHCKARSILLAYHSFEIYPYLFCPSQIHARNSAKTSSHRLGSTDGGRVRAPRVIGTSADFPKVRVGVGVKRGWGTSKGGPG